MLFAVFTSVVCNDNVIYLMIDNRQRSDKKKKVICA